MMNIVIAPDSFKGSLTSTQASTIMKKAVLDVLHNCDIQLKPMADGGEGTLDSLLSSPNSERVSISCMGPLGERINTSYGIVNKATAIIECAKIVGLTQVPEAKRNPDITTSYGIGQVIIDALDKGCTSIVVGLGGSATNDGGLGMLQALGMKVLDKYGVEVGPYERDLFAVSDVCLTGLDTRLASVNIMAACDVDNPLCGTKGASVIYGPQKGATANQVTQYDRALNKYGDLIEEKVNKSYKDVPGSGAAGGLGFALLAIDADLVSGSNLIADAVNLEESINHAGLVLTGEGQSDEQTLYGKVPGYVADLAVKNNVPVILISGSIVGEVNILLEKFTGCFSIIQKPLSLKECMRHADTLLFGQTKQVIHLIHSLGYFDKMNK
ncbi:glycerate kinase [Virgibacillus sp. FSP13]